MGVGYGFSLALLLALLSHYLTNLIGTDWMGLPKSPVSPIMVAILLGILVRNAFNLPSAVEPGIRFCFVRVLRLGIVLLGIRLSLGEVGTIGLKSLPIIVGTVGVALIAVTYFSKRMGLSSRLGTLIAVGTGICGASAIVAAAPTIKARDDEISYSVACITLFGVVAMLVYPFAAHWLFAADSFRSGLFLGTAVHETAQVAGSGLLYQQFFGDSAALDVATVTKLVRNMGMLLAIPILAVLYQCSAEETSERAPWYRLIPLFLVGFAVMSLVRTIGDMGDRPWGFMDPEQWRWLVATTKKLAEYCLAIAMTAVGLGTRIATLRSIGLKPLCVGLFSALLVGMISAAAIGVLY